MKDGLAATHFHLLEAKLVHSFNEVRYFKLHDEIFVNSALMSSYTIFTMLGSCFWAPRYRSPLRASTPLSYIVHIRSTHIHAKAFVGSRGEQYSIKLFLISIYFIVKMIV